LLALCVGATADAHQSSLIYGELTVAGRAVDGSFQIRDRELAPALGPIDDRGGERPVTRSDVRARQASLLEYVAERVHVTNAGFACVARPLGVDILDKPDGFFAVARLRWECKRTAAELVVRDDLFFDLDPRHQALVRVSVEGQAAREQVFRAGARELSLERPASLADHVRDYLRLGIEHIFTGYDHLAFLFGLLVVAGLGSLRAGLRSVAGIVTAFTVAHSLTLIAAGLGWVRLPPRVVEPAIALSIAYVAVENLVVPRPRGRWLLTFGFGLVHGFGFASVLREIGLPPRGLVLSLVSFNLGVEIGQLAVVALVAPALHLLGRARLGAVELGGIGALALLAVSLLARFELPLPQLVAAAVGGPTLLAVAVPRVGFERAVRRGGSAVLVLLSSLWFFERVLGRALLGGWLG
jgi:hypothetical protein